MTGWRSSPQFSSNWRSLRVSWSMITRYQVWTPWPSRAYLSYQCLICKTMISCRSLLNLAIALSWGELWGLKTDDLVASILIGFSGTNVLVDCSRDVMSNSQRHESLHHRSFKRFSEASQLNSDLTCIYLWSSMTLSLLSDRVYLRVTHSASRDQQY